MNYLSKSKWIILFMCLNMVSCSTSMYVLGYNVWHEQTQIPHPYEDENLHGNPYYSPTANDIMYAETGFGSSVASVLTIPIGIAFAPIFLIAGNIAGASDPKDPKEHKQKSAEELIELYEKEVNAK